MNARRILIVALAIVGLAGLLGVFAGNRELADLRAKHEHMRAQLDAAPDISPAPDTATSPAPELLQLRNQISQLTRRKAELTAARTENEQLHAQLAARGTNATDSAFPPGYIRRSQAQWVGADSPEHVLQSFLWALQNHDVTRLNEVLGGDASASMLKQISASPETFFKEIAALPGMRIVSQVTAADGASVDAQVEILPGQSPAKIRFVRYEHFNAAPQWVIDQLH